VPIEFEPLRPWLTQKTADGLPFSQAGVTTHGDMLVVNVAPGCEYFLHKHDGVSMRCTFCAYGAPDERTVHLGQKTGRVEIPPPTLDRMAEALHAVIDQTEIRHIYLVGGSLTDARKEGERFLQLARFVKQANTRGIPVALGSGALPDDVIEQFHAERLVQHVCFNLEMWSEALFAKVCPGKNRYVGYTAGSRRSRRRCGSGAAATSIRRWSPASSSSPSTASNGKRRRGSRSRAPRTSAARHHSDLLARLAGRRRAPVGLPRAHPQLLRDAERGLSGDPPTPRPDGRRGFMCHRCAYMQLECDLDRSQLVAA
jgi:hypothetical protein